MKHILCYGDSNTWGFQPGFGGRYPRQRRWTGVAEGLLGDGYVLLENGLNGRTTDFDDPELPYRNGRKGFAYAMVSQKPIDLLLLMLGTNDLKFTTAEGSRDGLASILEEALLIFHTRSKESTNVINPIEERIDEMKDSLRNRHIERRNRGECTPRSGMIFLDLVTNLERIADHATNIAYSVREM